MNFRRLSIHSILRPSAFLETLSSDKRYWRSFDFAEWSHKVYEWSEDDWNGYKDVVELPKRTIMNGTGDCEDYAVVAMNARYHQNADTVGLGFCFDGLVPRHVVAYDDTTVYTSGHILGDTTPEQFVENTDYDRIITRPVKQ